MLTESVTEVPTRIDEVDRLVLILGVALPTEIEIVTECDIEPPLAETVSVKAPLPEDGQETIELPEPPMFDGESVHKSPIEGDGVAARVTDPTKPLRPVTVRVEFAAVPTVTLTVAGPATIVKSWTV